MIKKTPNFEGESLNNLKSIKYKRNLVYDINHIYMHDMCNIMCKSIFSFDF